MDLNREIQTAVKKNKTLFGIKQAESSIKSSAAKLVVISANCPSRKKLEIFAREFNAEVQNFGGDSVNLGAVCEKPFSISVLTILK